MFSSTRKIGLLLMVLIATVPCISQTLTEGVWQGSLTNALGKRYAIYYNIEYPEDNLSLPNIVMVNMDLEPTPEFTYVLQDIEVKEQTLNFKIPRLHDTRICQLTKQHDQSYSGQCQSDMATQGETSQIIMTPPRGEEEI